MRWLFLAAIGVAVFSLEPRISRAAEAAAQPYTLAIVIGGGRTEDDAKKAINEFRNTDSGKVRPAEGFPKIISSDDVPGAPPDTHIAVLGYCEPTTDSGLVKKIVRAISIGAYSMAIAGKFENSCPALAPELMKDEPEGTPPAKKRRRQ